MLLVEAKTLRFFSVLGPVHKSHVTKLHSSQSPLGTHPSRRYSLPTSVLHRCPQE